MTHRIVERVFPAVLASIVVAVLSGQQTIAQSSTPSAVEPQQFVPSQPLPAVKDSPKAPITILEDTLIRVMTNEPVNSKHSKHGTPVSFTVSEDVQVGDVLAIPRGATVHGIVIKSKKAGRLSGSPELRLELVSLELGGRSYPLYTYQFRATGTSKIRQTKTDASRGAYVGAIAGSMVGGVSTKGGATEVGQGNPVSIATGFGVGAGVGTVVSAATPGPGFWIPAEAEIDFHLAAPITVTPVSAKEAARLSQGLYPGGPTLYVRDENP